MFSNRIPELAAAVSPLQSPSDWDDTALERNKGILVTEFPDDFVEFGKVFGSGTFRAGYSWEVWSPARKTYPSIVMNFSRNLNLFKTGAEIDDVPFGIFPEPSGLLPFARTKTGGLVGWITEGDPNDWKVVDLDSYEADRFQILEMGFSEYFFNVLMRKVVLNRDEHGTPWSATDVSFEQTVYMDQNY